MPIQKITSLTRGKGSNEAVLRFYEVRSRYHEDEEILTSVTKMGWVLIPLDDIGAVMRERDIYEFWTEDDVRIHESMAELSGDPLGDWHGRNK
jgi:hypothetical protein